MTKGSGKRLKRIDPATSLSKTVACNCKVKKSES